MNPGEAMIGSLKTALAAMPASVWLAVAAILIIHVLRYILSRPSVKGRIGERRVSGRLRAGLSDEYVVIDDVYLPTREGETTQVDHVVVSPYGIFVVETKNWTGWIFGNGDSPKWTQCVYRKKSSFQNPIRQNYRHICELARNLGIDEGYFHGVVAVTGDCKFKTEMPEGVVFSRKAAEYIRSFRDELIARGQIGEVADAIRAWNSSVGEDRRKSHVDNLKRRHVKRIKGRTLYT